MFATLAAMSAIGFFSIIALHYLPWHRLHGGEIQAPTTYVIGVCIIGSTFSVWCAWAQPTWTMAIAGFWTICAFTGAGDVIAYWLDSLGGEAMVGRTHGRTPGDGIERN